VTGTGITFFRASPPATSFPYVDDESLDKYEANSPTIPNANLRAAWTNARNLFGGAAASVVLPETACRRGGFNFHGAIGPAGTHFQLFDEPTFLARWHTTNLYQRCRVQTVDALASAGLYDPTFVTIDIDPAHGANIVDLRSRGYLTVAIFSTSGFDARAIDPGSLRLAGASQRGSAKGPRGIRSRLADLDGDGRMDLQIAFPVNRLRFTDIDIVADLWGQTRRGVPFAGSDVVQVVQ
jgi:hypothetical protein